MFRFLIILALVLLQQACSLLPTGETIHYYQVETTKPYDDVLAELEIAITEQNFRITGHSRVGKVIRQREIIPFPEYDTVQYCNLTHAKKLLELSPHAIRHMPCNVVTYTYAGKVIIKSRLLPTNTNNSALNQFSTAMNNKVKEIINFAAE